MNVLKYNKYNFIVDNLPSEVINESSEFADMQMGQMPLGTGYGFAQDSQMSIYSDGSSPYLDNYARMSQVVQDLNRVMKDLYASGSTSIIGHKLDYFLEDLEEYQNLKILRIFINNTLNIDVFISFDFMEEEFFGVYRNYNGLNKTKLSTDLFTDPRFGYIDVEYKLKLSNYLYKILFNWFVPDNGDYVVLSDELKVKDALGNNVMFKKGKIITIKGYNLDVDNQPFLIIHSNENIFKIIDNDFFYFKYRCNKR